MHTHNIMALQCRAEKKKKFFVKTNNPRIEKNQKKTEAFNIFQRFEDMLVYNVHLYEWLICKT